MNKVVKITESDLNRLVKKTLTECVRTKVSRQLEKECVEALLECTTVAMLESFFGDYVKAINENCTYTLNEAKLNEAEQRRIINEVYAIYEKSFIRECRRQLGEMMTEGEVNEFLPLVAGAAGMVGKKLLGGLAKKAVGGIANRLGKGAIGKGIKNVVGGLGKNLLNGGLAQMASGAGAAGGGNLMNLLKNGGGNLANILGGNPGILNSLLGGGNGNAGGNNSGNGNAGGNNGANLMSMLMNLISGGNGGGMASSLANMFGGSNSKSSSTAKGGNTSAQGGGNANAGGNSAGGNQAQQNVNANNTVAQSGGNANAGGTDTNAAAGTAPQENKNKSVR